MDSSGITSIAFNHCNQLAITSSYDHTIRFWDIKEQKEITEIRDGANSEITSVSFSPDGKYYIYSDWDAIHIKDYKSQTEIYTLKINDAQHVSFSNDGKYIYAICGDYNSYHYKGNALIRIPFPSYEAICNFFQKKLNGYTISKQEKTKYFLD